MIRPPTYITFSVGNYFKSEHYLPSLDSLSSLLSDVKIDFALLVMLVFFDTELIFDGTGDGVLLTEAGFDVDCPGVAGLPVDDVPSLGAGTVELVTVSLTLLALDGAPLSS